MTTIINNKLNDTLKVMLKELKEECFEFIKLTNQLDLENLTEVQIEEILEELTASVTHLNVHSKTVKEEIEDWSSEELFYYSLS